MKLIAAVAASMVLLAQLSFAVQPAKMGYQGRLSENGRPINGNKSVVFKFYDVETGGTPLLTLAPQQVFIHDGAFTASIDLANLPIAESGQLYLEVIVEGTVLTPRDPLRSVPSAITARSVHGPNKKFPETGDVDVAGSRIINLATPVSAGDAANKAYVDLVASSVSAGGTGAALLAADQTFTGLNTFNSQLTAMANVGIGTASPGAKLHLKFTGNEGLRLETTDGAAPVMRLFINGSEKAAFSANVSDTYIGSSDGSTAHLIVNGLSKVAAMANGNVGIGTSTPTARLQVAGAMRVDGEIDARSNKLVNLATPASPSDAATKAYVDGMASGGSGEVFLAASQTFTGQNTFAGHVSIATTVFLSNGHLRHGPQSEYDVTAGINVGRSGSDNISAFNGTALSNAASGSAVGAALSLKLFRGSYASPAPAQTNDILGIMDFGSTMGAPLGVAPGVRLYGYADGNWSGTSTPGRFGIRVTTVGVSNIELVPDAFTILSSGRVGIGTTSPSQKLSVAGTVESTSGGFKFPDGSVQTSAASGGAGGGVTLASTQTFTGQNTFAAHVAIATTVFLSNGHLVHGSQSQHDVTAAINVGRSGSDNISTFNGTVLSNAASGSAVGAALSLKLFRGTFATPTPAQTNDILGFMDFGSTMGAPLGVAPGVRLYGYADGNWSGTNTPGRFGIRVATVGVNNIELVPDALTILSSGRVGIGTTSPGQKLTVAGTVESTSGGFKFPDGSIQTSALAGAGSILTTTNTFTGTNSYSTTTVFAGTIGVGVTTPRQRVEINGPANIWISSGMATGEYSSLSFNVVPNRWGLRNIIPITDYSYLDAMIDTTGQLGPAHSRGFRVIDTRDSTVHMFVSETGRVGIGTIAPGAKLQVDGGDAYVATIAKGLILKSPDGTCYRVTVANGGALQTASLTCP